MERSGLAPLLHIALPVPRVVRGEREKRGPVAYITLQHLVGARLRCEARRGEASGTRAMVARRGKARRAERGTMRGEARRENALAAR